jgi:hypothetical protein
MLRSDKKLIFHKKNINMPSAPELNSRFKQHIALVQQKQQLEDIQASQPQPVLKCVEIPVRTLKYFFLHFDY